MKAKLLLVTFILPIALLGQETLDAEQLLNEVLKNAFGLKLAEQSVALAEVQNNAGNAGLLPSLSINAGGSYSNNNAELSIINQAQPIIIDGAQATQLNAGLTLNYTLFNGFAGTNTLKRLGIQEDLADVNKRAQVELVISNTLQAYYSAAGLQKSLRAAKKSLDISRDRMERAKLKYDYGGQSKLEYLSAQVDFSNDSVALLNAALALNLTKRQLNYLMAKNQEDLSFDINEDVQFDETLSKESLMKKAEENNANIRNAKMNIMLAEQDVKIANANYFPRLNLTGGYNYISSENEASVLNKQVSFGFNAGLNLSYNLFAANQRKTAAKISQINLQSRLIQEEDAIKQMNRDFENAWENYEMRQKLMRIEEQNLRTAEMNFERAEELYKLGAITNVQFRDAQLNLLRGNIRSIQSKYDLKLSEIELLRVSGQLMSK